jgi:dTMP kinase
MKPLFIVFEGLDGSGTSTQARRLHDSLVISKKQRVRLTSEPSSGPVGQMIRTAMSGRLQFTNDSTNFDRQMAFLFAADRNDHLHNDTDGILKLLSQNYFVISTRYYFSSFAYHCRGTEDFEFVRSLNRSFPSPDLTIFLDVPVSVSVARLSARSHLDKYEHAQKLDMVQKNYANFFSSYQGALVKIDGEKDEASIHNEIVGAVQAAACQ